MAKKQLSIAQLKAGFGVAHMTIFNWRAGTPTKEALPAEKGENGRVVFDAAAVKAWAKKHGLKFTMPTEDATWKSPGPVAGAKKAAAKKATKAPAKKAVKLTAKAKAQAAAVIEKAKHKANPRRADAVSSAMVKATSAVKRKATVPAAMKPPLPATAAPAP